MLNNIYASDSGKILTLPAQIAIQNFTLPLPEAGLCYKIIAGNTIAFAVTIATNPGGLFYGSLSNLSTVPLTDVNTGGAGTAVNIPAIKGGANNVVFGAAARAGDFVEMVCDGNSWYVHGVSITSTGTGLA